MSATVAVAEPPAGLFGPLRGRSFRLLWIGGSASNLADQLSIVALAWLALQLTGSPLTVGAVLTAAAVPRAGLMLLGGTFADRLGGQRLAFLTAVVRVAAMGLLATLVLLHVVLLWELYALSLIFGIADAFYGPARGTLMPRTVAPAQLEAANSLTGVTSSLAGFAGPALAGVLIARAGTGFGLAGDSACFVVVAVTTAAIRLAPVANAQPAVPTTVLADLAEGFRYFLRDPMLRSLMLVAGTLNLAASGPVEVGLALLARTHLGGPTGLGLMLGGFGAGSLIGALLAGLRPGGSVALRLYGAGAFFGLLMPLLGFVPNIPAAMALTTLMGIVAGAVGVGLSSWVMRRTDPRLMGRMVGMLSLVTMGTVPFSLAAAGALAQVSVQLMFVISGAMMLIAGLVALATGARRD